MLAWAVSSQSKLFQSSSQPGYMLSLERGLRELRVLCTQYHHKRVIFIQHFTGIRLVAKLVNMFVGFEFLFTIL